MPVVTFHPHESSRGPKPVARVATVPTGTSLLDAAAEAGVVLTAPCGGEGVCGECRVRAQSGSVDYVPRGCLSADEMAEGWVLACSSRVAADVAIYLPPREMAGAARIVADGTRPGDESGAEVRSAEPLARKRLLHVARPCLENYFSDVERLVSAVRHGGGSDSVTVGLDVQRNLAMALRAKDHEVTATIVPDDDCAPTGVAPVAKRCEIVSIEPGDTTECQLGLAIDVGTTTCAVSLVDVRRNGVLGTAADYNGQLSRGADIISRINYAKTPERTAELRGLVLDTINALIERLCESQGVAAGRIDNAVVAGNTTMLHLLLGLDPKFIRLEPYTPTINRPPRLRAAEVGLTMNPAAYVLFAPGVGSYVGGDITAGLLGTALAADGDAERSEGPSPAPAKPRGSGADGVRLYLDIGTNGEVVVGTGEWLMTCAASAGPAFEGSGVSCGMRAGTGAIERIRVDPNSGRADVTVIGGGRPRGVCGSGMIDLLAELYTGGLLDPSGKFNPLHAGGMIQPAVQRRRIPPSDKATVNSTRREAPVSPSGRNLIYTIVPASDSATGSAITIDQRDIQNLIRTKAAVYSACAIMLKSVGLEVDAITEVYVAGGFGRYLDLRNSIVVGLLPDLPLERFTYLGNAALTGARSMLCDSAARRNVSRLADRMTYLELNADPAYMSEYTAALFLPHTDIDRFPTVRDTTCGQRSDRSRTVRDRSDARADEGVSP